MTQQSNQRKPNIIRRAINNIDSFLDNRTIGQLRSEMALDKSEKSLQASRAKLEEVREKSMIWMEQSSNEIFSFPDQPQRQMSDYMRNEVHKMD